MARTSRPRYRRSRPRTRYGNRYTTKAGPAWSYALSVALGLAFVPATFGLSLLAIPVLCLITYSNFRKIKQLGSFSARR
jgi:hypothetical protein